MKPHEWTQFWHNPHSSTKSHNSSIPLGSAQGANFYAASLICFLDILTLIIPDRKAVQNHSDCSAIAFPLAKTLRQQSRSEASFGYLTLMPTLATSSYFAD
jgi:hypothetical protein